MKMMAAKGVVPGAAPPDLMTILVGLSQSDDAKVAEAAQGTLKAPPKPLLEGALNACVCEVEVNLVLWQYVCIGVSALLESQIVQHGLAICGHLHS